ncbi:PIG-L deacetylase family protein [Clostridium saccharoperbutylacetonicum]|uniref:PIG-L deacetylase family protein n=1 Tax=Clostridium saccharoperbutylacetonicum TaxID=36745 RepID=UPI000983A820|nr:PIG-L deacetylase family protein [Clostridium saccharoperbutylacetonicum]AQR96979.1 GlcNAc-PI de-N-acetylase [Clostridium saccharoperbutylacetonicum]NSB32858.1 LmbE family N-acetylglucosaminyl deacetylase [Clostridium saccharoperbutylacetonicum]
MNILAIGAHFDDVELGCGGALAKHAQNGDKVYIYIATVSGYSNHSQQIIRSNDIALNEGRNASKILGAELINGNFETLRLEFIDEVNVELLNIIESKNIDQVYTHWTGDIHHDHSSLARASLHSCRHIKRILMYRSNWYHSSLDFRGNFYIDISDTWNVKENAIMAHESEYNRVGRKWIEFFKNEAENSGQRIGVKYAEVFEVVSWLEI